MTGSRGAYWSTGLAKTQLAARQQGGEDELIVQGGWGGGRRTLAKKKKKKNQGLKPGRKEKSLKNHPAPHAQETEDRKGKKRTLLVLTKRNPIEKLNWGRPGNWPCQRSKWAEKGGNKAGGSYA